MGGKGRIGLQDGLGIVQRRFVDIAADAVPAILGMRQQGIDQVGTGTDIQQADLAALRQLSLLARPADRQCMNVIGTPGMGGHR
jgi:hypothetical protein